MHQLLERLNNFETLSYQDAYEVLIAISDRQYNEAQITAFISAFKMRSITVDELRGFKDALNHLALDTGIDPEGKIDLCGTGGDGKNTFNISTVSSVVLSATGIKVTKHGNSAVSSLCGSSNVLQSFGYQFTSDQSTLNRQVEQFNLCFLHAPLFHPAMKSVGQIRRDLGVKTFFNMLGPLVNPVQPEYQSVGVYSLKLQRLYYYIFQQTDRKYSIIHDLNGYDEVSLTGIAKNATNEGVTLVSHEDFGVNCISPFEIQGGATIEASRQIFLSILENTCTTIQKNVVSANVAIAMQLYHPTTSLIDLFNEAKEVIESGEALSNFTKLLSSQ